MNFHWRTFGLCRKAKERDLQVVELGIELMRTGVGKMPWHRQKSPDGASTRSWRLSTSSSGVMAARASSGIAVPEGSNKS